jgi:phosphoribosylformimino-5-aminoimidazole carboxamide ribotide isomerase
MRAERGNLVRFEGIRGEIATAGRIRHPALRRPNCSIIFLEPNESERNLGSTMKIIPAIDIIGGKCVRLSMGDYARVEEFSDDPVEVARRWQEGGAELIHLVDLEGAKAGKIANARTIEAIASAVEIRTELGGGLRDMRTIETVLSGLGVDRAILGTVALKHPEIVEEAAGNYGERIVVGIDARDGMVATEGWLETSETPAVELAAALDGLGTGGFIYTDISRDGMMQGPNLEAVKHFAEHVTSPVVASGGVTTVEDVVRLRELGVPNITGVIIGKALYRGTVKLEDAIAAARGD